MIAGHIDALTARVKPVSNKKTTHGYVQLGVAPFAGALNSTWWDRDLGIGGKVVVKDTETGKIVTKLVKLDWPSKFPLALSRTYILTVYSRTYSYARTSFWRGYDWQPK